jgi:hypothetical protein
MPRESVQLDDYGRAHDVFVIIAAIPETLWTDADLDRLPTERDLAPNPLE